MALHKVHPHPRYRNVIFDIGAVLVQWNPKQIIEDLFKKNTQKPYKLASITLSQEWVDLDKGIINEDQLIEKLATKFTFSKQDITLFVKKYSNYLIPIQEGIEMFYHIKNQGFNVYLLSNVGERSLKVLQQTTNFFDESDGYVASCEVKSAKPEPYIYNILLKKFSLKPEECLFIDDNKENIETGKSLGMDGIICKNHSIVYKQLKKLCIIDK